MIVNKELVTLYNQYRREVGSHNSDAGYLTLAHVVLELKRTLQSAIIDYLVGTREVVQKP